MSRDGLFWARATTVNDRGTPVTALAGTGVAGLAFAITGTFERLLTSVAVLNLTTYCAALMALLALQRRAPGLARPMRSYLSLTLVAFAVGCTFLVLAAIGDPRSSARAVGLAAGSYPLHHAIKRCFAA